MMMKTAATPPLLTDGLSKLSRFWLVAFALVSGFHLLAEGLGWTSVLYFSKPTLMWWLLFFVWQHTKHQAHPAKWPLVAAILAANAGDIFLLFANRGEQYFLLGLGSFLLAHLAYIRTFYLLHPDIKRPPWWLITTLVAIWFGFNAGMWAGMPLALKPAVMIYSLVILFMVLFAWNLFAGSDKSPTAWVWWGALLFLLSDTCIGLNKFGQHLLIIPQVRLLIMATYLLGQLGIVFGASQLILASGPIKKSAI